MGRQGRKVCLLLDNCSAHNVEDIKLEHVQLKFFPPNCTSVIHPLDQGVIESIKRAYRKRVIRLLLNARRGCEMKINIVMALQLLAASWCATSDITIANCFRHAGFAVQASEKSGADADDDEVYELPSDDFADAWAALRETGDVPANVHLEDLSNEDILKSVRADSALSDDEEGIAQVEPTPLTLEVMDAFNTIRRIISVNEDNGAMALLIECESRDVPMLAAKRKQEKITNFLH